MLILDTNVLSVMMQPATAPQVLDWLDRQPVESIWTTTITLYEIRFGLGVMPEGKRRRTLENYFAQILHNGLAERVLDFDTGAAFAAADLAAKLRLQGLTIDIRDLEIAGIAASRRSVLATRNTKHFLHAGIELVDPWEQ